MNAKSEYEERLQELVEDRECTISKLQTASRDASPEVVEEYKKNIAELIAKREATRRGLLCLNESGDDVDLTCPS